MAEFSGGAEGWSAEQIFSPGSGYTLDEIAVLPGAMPTRTSGVELTCKLTRSIELRVPLVGGPSCIVVDKDMAIGLALRGSMGFIHRNQSVASQTDMVKRVKDYEHGFILDPATLGPYDTVADLDKLRKDRGFSSVPITDNRRTGGKLLGLVTARDVDGIQDRSGTRLASVMVPVQDLIVAQEPITLREAQTQLCREKLGKLPVVNKDRELVAMVCRGDIIRQRDQPSAARDANRQLRVGAALGADASEWSRAEALVAAGADALYVDVDDGLSDSTIELIKQLKINLQGVEVIVGRVSSCRQAKAVLDAGGDAIRIGSLAGVSEASAIYEIANFARTQYGAPVIADVGATTPDHLLKALCLGASCVVVDEFLKGTAEMPGKQQHGSDGIRYKIQETEDGSPDLEHLICRGSCRTLLRALADDVRRSLADLGYAAIPNLHQALSSGNLRLERCCQRVVPAM